MSLDPDTGPPLRLDDDGVPILDEVVDEAGTGTPEERLKAKLLEELEPQIQALAHSAFVHTVKTVALEMKRSFEQEFDEKLQERLEELVDQAVAEACEADKNDD
jgi:hypothetical protein